MIDQDRMREMLVLMSPSATKAEKAQASQRMAMAKGNVVPELDWQRFMTLKGTGGAATRIVQGSDGWIYVGDVPAVSVRTEVPFITAGATLRVETAVSLDGPWRDVVLQTAEGNATYVLGTEPFGGSFVGSAVPLRQYLRWAVQPPAGDWIICFRIGLASPAQLQPPTSITFADFGTALPETGFGIMFDWTTVTGTWAATSDEIVAPVHTWLDLSREVYAYVEVSTLDMNNGANSASLIIETSMYREGPWTTVIGPVSTDNTTTAVKLTMEGSYAVALQRYVRWRIVAPVGPWHACFRVAARWA
ncbi:MAG: hypothetical protein IV100_06615 [Myxococcales bacterium]|nr:hypothetical protein [Myxococcales bacterium]